MNPLTSVLRRLVLVTAAVAVGLGSAPASGDDPTRARAAAKPDLLAVEAAQPAYLQFPDGRVVVGTLLSLNEQGLRFKRAGNLTPTVTYKPKDVKAVQVRAGVYLYDKDQGGFVKQSPAKDPEVGPEKLKAGPGDDPAPLQQVVAEGVGRTADEALKDAYRNAVRQVVGAVVDAETLVKDDELISDKVLTYSDGLVKTYRELSRKAEGGLVRTRIEAQVERRSVIARLRAASVSVKGVDGQGLFAEVITELEAQRNAKELVQKALEGFPHSVLEVEVVGKPEVIEKRESGVKVRVRVQLRVNPKAYEAFLGKLRATLRGVAKATGEFTLRPDGWARQHGIVFPKGDLRTHMPVRRAVERQPPPECVVAVNTLLAHDLGASAWELYRLDGSTSDALTACCDRVVSVKLSLLGGDGKVIAASSHPLVVEENEYVHRHNVSLIRATDEYKFVRPGGGGVARQTYGVFISPLPLSYKLIDGGDYVRYPDLPVDFSLSLDELRAVQSVKCELLGGS